MSACTFDRLTLVLVLAVVTVATALSPVQSDTWWHLRAGADIVHSHRIALVDSYSHTAYGLPWPNHEWLAQVLLYGAYALGGLPLVGLCTAAMIAGAWALIWRLCDGPGIRRFVVVALLLVPASLHWSARPHAFSLLFLAVAMTLVIAERVWWLPVLFFIWANCHGGVVLGLVVGGVALVTSLHTLRGWRRPAAVFVACVAAATLTPLGISFWTEIARSLARISQYPIDEWRAPSFGELPLAPFWVSAGAVCIGVARQWRALLKPDHARTRTLCACALAVLPLAVTAVRNVGPFVMCAAPALCSLLELARSERADGKSSRTRAEHPRINLAAIATTAVLVAFTIVSAYRRQIPHLRWTPLPADSLEALNRCPDNLYNRYDEGGYLLWFAPERRVFLDGRQDPYPPRLIEDQLRVEHSGDYASTFGRYQIHCAYLPTSSPVSSQLVSAGWTTLYRDGQWIVLATPKS